jgi:hypothetical protein
MTLFSSRTVSHSISGTTDMVSGVEDYLWLFGIVPMTPSPPTRFDGIGLARASIRYGARLWGHMMPSAVACPASLPRPSRECSSTHLLASTLAVLELIHP